MGFVHIMLRISAMGVVLLLADCAQPGREVVVAAQSVAPTASPVLRTTRRPLGIIVVPRTQTIAYASPVDPQRHIVVIAVEHGGAADGSGILAGDILLTFAGAPITSVTDLTTTLAAVAPNSIVDAGLLRDGAFVHARLIF